MNVLLDTCVLSELRRPKCNPGVRRAVESFDDENIFVSVISIGEIAKGIALLRENENKRALRLWLHFLERTYIDRILPIDLDTSRIWGEITANAQNAGFQLPVSDGLIAATARRHALQVMTRNSGDFEPTGVLVINPWINQP